MALRQDSLSFWKQNIHQLGFREETVVSQCLRELIDNSIDSQRDTHDNDAKIDVGISIDTLASTVDITVTDSGLGMNGDIEGIQTSSFTSSKQSGGTSGMFGLGLKGVLLVACETNKPPLVCTRSKQLGQFCREIMFVDGKLQLKEVQNVSESILQPTGTSVSVRLQYKDEREVIQQCINISSRLHLWGLSVGIVAVSCTVLQDGKDVMHFQVDRHEKNEQEWIVARTAFNTAPSIFIYSSRCPSSSYFVTARHHSTYLKLLRESGFHTYSYCVNVAENNVDCNIKMHIVCSESANSLFELKQPAIPVLQLVKVNEGLVLSSSQSNPVYDALLSQFGHQNYTRGYSSDGSVNTPEFTLLSNNNKFGKSSLGYTTIITKYKGIAEDNELRTMLRGNEVTCVIMELHIQTSEPRLLFSQLDKSSINLPPAMLSALTTSVHNMVKYAAQENSVDKPLYTVQANERFNGRNEDSKLIARSLATVLHSSSPVYSGRVTTALGLEAPSKEELFDNIHTLVKGLIGDELDESVEIAVPWCGICKKQGKIEREFQKELRKMQKQQEKKALQEQRTLLQENKQRQRLENKSAPKKKKLIKKEEIDLTDVENIPSHNVIDQSFDSD